MIHRGADKVFLLSVCLQAVQHEPCNTPSWKNDHQTCKSLLLPTGCLFLSIHHTSMNNEEPIVMSLYPPDVLFISPAH